jgi:diguanylate cyclase (GGDEF)-like protein
MKAAAAARAWWAARRRPPQARSSSLTRAGNHVKSVRLAAFLLVILSGVTIACAVIGFAVTTYNDRRAAAERDVALHVALDEFRASFGGRTSFDGAQLRLIARRAGLNDLRFAADAPPDVGREVQSLQDANGRIVGWFSWVVDRSLIAAMDRLWALVAIAGLGLGACAILTAHAVQWIARALRRSNETVRKLTYEDPLTGLPNQRAILVRLDQELAKSSGAAVVLALIDVDGFREVNDSLGRAGGDAVLKTLTERLTGVLPAYAVFGRFEEDQFAVFMSAESGEDRGAVDQVVAAVRAALRDPIVFERPWQLGASAGIAQSPRDGAAGEELVRRAGLALRAAKDEGRGVVRDFAPQIETAHADRRFLLRELEAAIARQAFDVHYQPIVAADGGALIGVEALLRWTHPARGAIAPAVFIPLAEQSGLMAPLGEIVLRRALADGACWRNLNVAVNLSPVQIRDPRLVVLVAAVLAESGIAPSRVVLEVTEGILIDDPQEAQARLEALQALGVSLALDDFGTGYSSLSYLQKFPFDRLKIDRAFVASLGASANAGAIIHSIVTLGHALGMKVLAEGVETDEQRVLLRLAGCDEMQGFLFAKPMPATKIDRMLAGEPASAQAPVRRAAS